MFFLTLQDPFQSILRIGLEELLGKGLCSSGKSVFHGALPVPDGRCIDFNHPGIILDPICCTDSSENRIHTTIDRCGTRLSTALVDWMHRMFAAEQNNYTSRWKLMEGEHVFLKSFEFTLYSELRDHRNARHLLLIPRFELLFFQKDTVVSLRN